MDEDDWVVLVPRELFPVEETDVVDVVVDKIIGLFDEDRLLADVEDELSKTILSGV